MLNETAPATPGPSNRRLDRSETPDGPRRNRRKVEKPDPYDNGFFDDSEIGSMDAAASDSASLQPAAGDDADRNMRYLSMSEKGFDDDAATVSTRTEDDPVSLAMRATLNLGEEFDDEDEEEDMVLYPVGGVGKTG